MPAPSARLELMREGEVFFLTNLKRAGDLLAPSALPNWSRATLAAHIARNADALANLLTWARTGLVTPMYSSAQARAEGIDQSARQSPDRLRADVESSSTHLMNAMAALPDEAWDATVKTARGREILASEVPWMRIRETWVHAVDLDVGVTFQDVSEVVVLDLIDEVATGLVNREDCPAVEVNIGSAVWRIGPNADAPATVRGTAPKVLAWLIGRGTIDGAPPPPPWL